MNPLLDKEFLKDLAHYREKEIYVKIISYDNEGQPQDTLEGIATGGSINVDGASPVRRSCSLTLNIKKEQEEETNIFFNLYWAITTQFELFIGLRNLIDSRYDNIIWFPMGWYLISSFSQNEDITSKTINISGKDKMCRLNGENGGLFTALTTILDSQENNKGEIEKIPIIDIIYRLLVNFGGEYHHNVIIKDLNEEMGLELLEYRGESPLYMFEDIDGQVIGSYTLQEDTPCKLEGDWTTISNKNIIYKKLSQYEQIADEISPSKVRLEDGEKAKEYYIIKIEYGETAGYKLVDGTGKLVYAGDLIMNLGESVTAALDKIIQMLGNYEYFYNNVGQFIFQKKRNLTTITTPKDFLIGEGDSAKIIFDFVDYEDMTEFEFTNDELVVSKNQSYNLNNIKNDFAVWGKRDDIDIYMRYAIDRKPTQYTSYDGIVYTTINEDIKDNRYLCDWREIIYRMAEDYLKHNHLDDFNLKIGENNAGLVRLGLTGYEKYYTDILGFWREIYDPNPSPIYSRINHEDAQLETDNSELFVDSFRLYTSLTDEEKEEVDRAQLYMINGEDKNKQLVRWIDTVDFENEYKNKLYNLYYYKNGEPIQIINSLDFITERAYIETSSGVYTQLVDTLTEEERNNVYVSNSIYSSKKYKYLDYIDLVTYLGETKTYTPGNELYAQYEIDHELAIGKVDNVKFKLGETEWPLIWQYDYMIDNLSTETIEMLQEAFITHKAKIKLFIEGKGEVTGNEVKGLKLFAKRDLSNGILWYKISENEDNEEEELFEYLNEYFLHDGSDSSLLEIYDKHKVYFERTIPNDETNKAKYRALVLINIDKAKIYEYIDGLGFTLVINNIDLPESNLYYHSENIKMKDPEDNKEEPNPLYQFYYDSDNKLQEFFIQSVYGLNGNKSIYYLTEQKKKIKYYLRSFDYILAKGNDWTNCWNKEIYNNFNKSKFWFDFLDTDNNMQHYSVNKIGDRQKIINNSKITGLDFNSIPEIIFSSDEAEWVQRKGYGVALMGNDDIDKMFALSDQGQSALDVIQENIDNLIKSNTSVSLSSLPLYWLDVNQQIIVNNTEFQKMYYEIKRITIPLTYNGKMSMELNSLE